MKKLILTLLTINILNVFSSGEYKKIDYLSRKFENLSQQNIQRFSNKKNRFLKLLKQQKQNILNLKKGNKKY